MANRTAFALKEDGTYPEYKLIAIGIPSTQCESCGYELDDLCVIEGRHGQHNVCKACVRAFGGEAIVMDLMDAEAKRARGPEEKAKSWKEFL